MKPTSNFLRTLRLWILSFLLALSAGMASAENLLVAGGAGYKRPISELATAFEKKMGIRLEQIYGHMGTVMSQAKQSGQVAVIFGDLSFFEKNPEITFAGFLRVGDGRLVVAWPKGGELKAAEELADPRFARIGLPDTRSAIYGIATSEFLLNSGLEPNLKDRLHVLSTVPQVSAYLVSGEIDAGFINLTEALALKDKLGGYLEIDGKLYSPIRIVAGIVKGFESQPAVNALGAFLNSEEARAILKKYGI